MSRRKYFGRLSINGSIREYSGSEGIVLIRLATIKDLSYIESLRRSESEAIGFIPKQRYEMEINGERSGTILIITENTDLVGFVYATHGGLSTKIQQIAIQEDARRMVRATALVAELERISNQKGFQQISCRCAQDLEANAFWEALGFNQVGVIDSKSMYPLGKEKWSRRGRQLNIYMKSKKGLWLPGSLGEYSVRLKPEQYPRTRVNTIMGLGAH